MSRYAVAWPSSQVRSILGDDQDAVFIDDYGWWVYSAEAKTRVLIRPSFSPSILSKEISVANIRQLINWWAPVWTRWFGNAGEYELLRSQSVIAVLKILSGLRSLDINIVIMHTGVPHHWDTSTVAIACEILKLKQVFLYAQVFDNCLLPLIQSQNINTRKVLSCSLKGGSYENQIDEFINRKLDDKPPATNPKPAFWKTSFLFSLLLIIYYSRPSVRWFLNLKQINKGEKSGWVLSDDYGLLGHINLVNKQRKFISTYKRRQISSLQLDKYISEVTPKLLLAAHYQPEATSFPEGGDYFNHVDIAADLRLRGYSDVLLYKEHPASLFYSDNVIGLTRVGLYRSDKYVKQLEELGCHLLPVSVPLSIASNRCKWYVPVTITGSIALERSLVGLHTIITGEPWFKGMPGLVHLTEINSLSILDPAWATPDSSLAKNAKSFLLDLLSDNTLVNYSGIGTGRPSQDPIEYQKFVSQLQSLIKKLKQ